MEDFYQGKSKIGQGKSGKNQRICFLKLCGHPGLKATLPSCFTAIRRLIPKGFHEVFMNFLGRHSFLTEVLDNSFDFKFLHFANVSHPPLLKVLYISNQAISACFSHSQCPSIRSKDRLTKILIQ